MDSYTDSRIPVTFTKAHHRSSFSNLFSYSLLSIPLRFILYLWRSFFEETAAKRLADNVHLKGRKKQTNNSFRLHLLAGNAKQRNRLQAMSYEISIISCALQMHKNPMSSKYIHDKCRRLSCYTGDVFSAPSIILHCTFCFVWLLLLLQACWNPLSPLRCSVSEEQSPVDISLAMFFNAGIYTRNTQDRKIIHLLRLRLHSPEWRRLCMPYVPMHNGRPVITQETAVSPT